MLSLPMFTSYFSIVIHQDLHFIFFFQDKAQLFLTRMAEISSNLKKTKRKKQLQS